MAGLAKVHPKLHEAFEEGICLGLAHAHKKIGLSAQIDVCPL